MSGPQPHPGTNVVTLIEEDFRVFDHGSIILLHPVSELARAWVYEFLPEDALWHGSSVCVERRYLVDVVDCIVEAGLTLA